MDQNDYNAAVAQASSQGWSEELTEVFAEYYCEKVILMREDADEDDSKTPEQWALIMTNEFIEKYKHQRNAGHSMLWAKVYAASGERHEHALQEAYEAVKSLGNTVAEKEALLYQEAQDASKAQGKSADYANAFVEKMIAGEIFTAETYAEALDEQLRAGKSRIYAQEYASQICEENTPRYARLYAGVYDQALRDGMPENYALLYTLKLADDLFDHAVTAADTDFYTAQAVGYIAGYRYAVENNLSLAQQFGEDTATAYMNQLTISEELEMDAELRREALQHALKRAQELNQNRMLNQSRR